MFWFIGGDFNLHSNMVLLLQSLGENNSNNLYRFTFQYGATSTQILASQPLSTLVFTFQYGATST